MVETNENVKKNGEQQESKKKSKMIRTEEEQRMDVNTLVEAGDRRKKWQDSSITGKRSEKTTQWLVGEE